ncbi:MAG: T9SS type A sorting domain-containing protein [Bacteroidota bacterium]
MMKKLLTIKNTVTCLTTFCFAMIANETHAQFTAGNLVVLQAGDGSTALSNTGNAVILKEFSTTGVPGYSVAVPTSSATGLVVLGNSTAEGLLTRSSNGQKLVLSGYAGTYTSSIASASGTLVPRVIGTVDAAGTFTRVASSTSFYSGGNIRSAASDGIGNYWANGSNNGTAYFGTTAAASSIQTTISNARALSIQAGDLAFSTGSGVPGIYVVNTIGSGTTTVPASTITLVVPTGTLTSPYQFAIAPSLTYGYVADDRSTSSGGGIQKWTFNGTAWTLAYTFATSTNTAVTTGARGLVVDFSGTNPVLYATSAETSSNRLISIVDGGSVVTSTITTLATATTSNTIFRGLAFSPTSSCTSPSITAIAAASPICSNQALNLTSSATGTGPLSYSWFGTGTFSSSSTISSPTVTGAASGAYTLAVTNSCGTATAVVTATVNPTPTITVNGSSICSGGSATLTATGAASYSWSPAGTLSASTGSTVTANPTSTTVYTITGTAGSCTNTAQSTVNVIASPTLAVNSVSICAGATTTLTASGVSTYTWTSPVSNNASVSVNPTSTTVYTVSGSASGCAGTFSATGTVSVTPLPTLTITPASATICAGQATTLTVSGVTSQVWAPGSQTTTAISVTPTTTITYTVNGSNAGCANSKTVTVTVNPLPTVTSTSASICVGKTTTLTASGTATSYSWNPSGVTTNTISVAAATAGFFTFTVTGTSSLGCSKSITTNLIGIPNPTINITATPSVICNGQSVTLTANGASTYTWTGGVVNGTPFSPTTTATYSVIGTSAIGSCTASAAKTVTVNTCTGIQENQNTIVFNVFPNPSTGNFTVQSSAFPAVLVMYDVTGKQVIRKEITEMETSVNVSQLNNGVYYISLTAESGSVNYKMLIAK